MLRIANCAARLSAITLSLSFSTGMTPAAITPQANAQSAGSTRRYLDD